MNRAKIHNYKSFSISIAISIFLFFMISMFFFLLSMNYKKQASLMASAACVSSGETVMEVSSGRVLFEKNSQKKLPMASTTKILTAIIIIEDCNLDESIEIPAQAVGIEGSSVYLKAGDKYTVKDLLYGLMLRSGNDCAVTLALHHSGNLETFSGVMNRKSRAWGALNSNFTNPHGLPDDNHYTTAKDLAVIVRHAMQNPAFQEIVSTRYYEKCHWQNKNKFLNNFEGANGIKTGFTKKAGRCLVTGAKRGDMQLVCVMLNSPEMYERSEELLNQAYQNYIMEKLYSVEQEFVVPTDVKNKTCILKGLQNIYFPLKNTERAVVTFDLPEKIELPVKKGEIKGKINIFIQNQLIFSENLCTIMNVEKNYLDYLNEVIEKF